MSHRIAILAGAATLATATPALADSYDSAALKWETAYIGLSAIDAAQTIYCLKADRCEESNPLFGKNPKASTVIIAKVLGTGLQFALFNEVRKRDPKMALRVAKVSFVMQGAVVGLNARFVF
jgi:hypothetical protein